MLLIAVYYRRCGRNLRAKFNTAINSLSANENARSSRASVFNVHRCINTLLSDITCVHHRHHHKLCHVTARYKLLADLLPARRSKRGTCYGNVAGWVAGWLSVIRRYCIKTAKPILKLFQPSGRFTVIVSSDSCANTQFQGETFSGGYIYTGVGKLAIFDGNRRLSRKRCEIGRWLLWNVNRKSWMPDRLV